MNTNSRSRSIACSLPRMTVACILLFPTIVALASPNMLFLVQNTNSQTTMTNDETKPSFAVTTNEATGKMIAVPAATPSQRRFGGRCDPTRQEQTDLSGTYTGKFNSPDGGLRDDATLTITGNDFTLTAGSETQSGRITAVTTCGYIAVTMMTGDLTPPPPGPNPPAALSAFSLRAKKLGGQLTLTSVPGEKRRISFQCDCSKCTRNCDCCP